MVKEKIATSPQSVATFVYSWGGRREFVAGERETRFVGVGVIRERSYTAAPNVAWPETYAGNGGVKSFIAPLPGAPGGVQLGSPTVAGLPSSLPRRIAVIGRQKS